MPKQPQDCTTMAELRVEIDRIDAALVALLIERAAYIDRVAEVKTEIGWPARIDARVEQVVQNVLGHAAGSDLPADLLEQFWRGLIEWSIAREDQKLGGA